MVDRLERLSKRFPPEVVVGITDPVALRPMRSYCVYPGVAGRSLSIKPCPKTRRKLRLLPQFEKIVPTTKPAVPRGGIR